MLGAPVPAYVHVTFIMTLDKTKTKKKTRLEPKSAQMCALDGAYGGAIFSLLLQWSRNDEQQQ